MMSITEYMYKHMAGLGWVKNGDKAGTEGMAKRTEAIQIQIRKKGDTSIKTSNGGLSREMCK